MNDNKHTKEDLRIMQAWSLERKIRVTQTRIIEWYEHFDGQVYVSFSGGKDSTVLLDLARRIYPDIEAVFVDTGLEYPEIKDFVKTFDNVTWLKPEMRFDEVIREFGYPVISKDVARKIKDARNNIPNAVSALDGKDVRGNETSFRKRYKKYKYLLESDFLISDECCNIMKKQPFHDYEKESLKKPMLGTMAQESELRQKAWLKTGCNAFGDKKREISQPMSFWTEQDVLQYLTKFNIMYSKAYGDIVENDGKLSCTKCNRTCCMFCMFGVHLEKGTNRFERMKTTHPKQYHYCINKLGCGKVLNYINVKY